MINNTIVITAVALLQCIIVVQARISGRVPGSTSRYLEIYNDEFHATNGVVSTQSLELTLDFNDKTTAKAVSCPFQKCQFLEEQIESHNATRHLEIYDDKFHPSDSVAAPTSFDALVGLTLNLYDNDITKHVVCPHQSCNYQTSRRHLDLDWNEDFHAVTTGDENMSGALVELTLDFYDSAYSNHAVCVYKLCNSEAEHTRRRSLGSFNDDFHPGTCPDQVALDDVDVIQVFKKLGNSARHRQISAYNDEFHPVGEYCLVTNTVRAQPLANTDAVKAPSDATSPTFSMLAFVVAIMFSVLI